MSQAVVLSKEGNKHVALLMTSSSKKAPSKLSQTAIAEGKDILASVMDISGLSDDLDDFEDARVSTKPVCKRLVVEASHSDTRTVIHKTPMIATIEPSSSSLYRPPAIQLSRPAIAPPLVTLQGGAVITARPESDKNAPTISHVSMHPFSTMSNTRQGRHMPPGAHNIPSLQRDTRHVAVADTLHAPLHDRRTKAVSNAAAWLPSE
jgi:hypothetical protein